MLTRGVVPASGRDGDQAAARQLVVGVALLVAGFDPHRVGQHPHLHEMHVGGRARVHLGVADAAPRTHALREARVDDPVPAAAVTVLELALEHPRHDLHVGVPVGPEAGSRGARGRRC